jgi:excisionase family DNA binding protein
LAKPYRVKRRPWRRPLVLPDFNPAPVPAHGEDGASPPPDEPAAASIRAAARRARAKQNARASVEPEFLTVLQFARLTALSRSGVYKLIDTGKLPSVKIGGAVRIPRSALEALRAGTTAPPAEKEETPAPTPRPRRAGGASVPDWRSRFGL